MTSQYIIVSTLLEILLKSFVVVESHIALAVFQPFLRFYRRPWRPPRR